MKRMCLFSLLLITSLSFLWSEESSNNTTKEKYQKFTARVNALYEPLFAGKAGSGSDPPSYVDAFRPGLGGGLEIGFSFHPRHQIIIGVENKYHDGKEFEGVKFSNRKLNLVYLSWKMSLVSTQESSIKPYIKVDIGGASLSSVHITYYRISNNYWDKSWVPMIRTGAGIELILFDIGWYSTGVYLEIKSQYMGRQPSLMSPHSDAGACWSFPVSLGMIFNL